MSLPGDTHLDKLNKEQAAYKTILGMVEKQKAAELGLLNKHGFDEAKLAGIATFTPDDGALERQKVELRKQFSNRTGIVEKEHPGVFEPIEEAIDDYRFGNDAAKPATEDTIAKLSVNARGFPKPKMVRSLAEETKSKLDAITEAQKKLKETSDEKERLNANEETRLGYSRYNALGKEEDSYRRKATELEASRVNQAYQDRFDVSKRIAISTGESFGVGDGKAEQFTNMIEGLKFSIAQKEAFAQKNEFSIPPAGKTIGDRNAETQNALVQAMQQRAMLSEALLKGEEMMREMHRDELNLIKEKNRELNRTLLLSSSGDLLRKLAVSQIGKSGRINAGQFFSFSADARKDILDLPNNSKEVQELRRGQHLLGTAGFGKKSDTLIQRDQSDGITARQKLHDRLSGVMPDSVKIFDNAVAAATTNLRGFGDKLADVNVALGRFETRLNAVGVGKGGGVTSTPPGTAQAPRRTLGGGGIEG
jgi:hypothetical protein